MGVTYYYTCECSVMNARTKRQRPKFTQIKLGSVLYPRLGQENAGNGIKQSMLSGKYGSKWQQLVESEPDGWAFSEYSLFVCDCGRWTNKRSTSYSFVHDGKKYKVNETPICPICNKKMRNVCERIPSSSLLTCPVCHKPLSYFSSTLYD